MLSKNQLGFLYMFMSICAFSLMDVIVKWSVDYPIGQVLFFRGFFGVLLYFLIQTLKRKRPKNDLRENEENTLNECRITPRRLKSRIPLGPAVKTRILSASEPSERQNSPGTRSENANFECQTRAGQAENDPQNGTQKGATVTKSGFALLFNTNFKKKTT